MDIVGMQLQKLLTVGFTQLGKGGIFCLNNRKDSFFQKFLSLFRQMDMHAPAFAGGQEEIAFLFQLVDGGIDGLFRNQG